MTTTDPPFIPPLAADFEHLADFDLGFGFGTPDFDLAGMRAAVSAAMPEPPASDFVRADRVVLDADAGVAIDTYTPTAPGPHPALVWFHGGGYVIGSAALDSVRMQRWAEDLGCFVASVDYRLAPDHRYPAAHDDAVRALEWVLAAAADHAIDAGRIVVGGASAGAGLAAGLALAARDRGIALAGQLLFYPMLDDRQQTASSTWEAPIWSQTSNEFGWRSYLGTELGDDVPAYAAPARAERLDGLPPTLVLVGAADRFFDEDVTYATRLIHAGVPTDVQIYAGAPHGFDLVAPESTTSLAAVGEAERWLRDLFAG
ncbi:alpha/beta hydrolase [Aquihabitans sp. McL0605]|uniref:alpha/beta hydrolase n=1 Tax=Aquihabitans sp. McL0605 TaxID=3415671 RepID=UPI003CF39F71